MESETTMDEIIKRWQRAAERADVEQVRVIEVDGEYRATSSSSPLRSYALRRSDRGWTCECIANRDYMLPCKHLAALAAVIDVDLIAETRVDVPDYAPVLVASAA
jgi:hypothetical protein